MAADAAPTRCSTGPGPRASEGSCASAPTSRRHARRSRSRRATPTSSPRSGSTRTTRRGSTTSGPTSRRSPAAPEVVAVGEAGFDLHYHHSPHDAQDAAFRAQIRLAHRLDRTLVIHTREAWDDTFRVLDDEGVPGADRVPLLHRRAGRGGACPRARRLPLVQRDRDVQERRRRAGRGRGHAHPTGCSSRPTRPTSRPCPHRGRENEPAYVGLVGDGGRGGHRPPGRRGRPRPPRPLTRLRRSGSPEPWAARTRRGARPAGRRPRARALACGLHLKRRTAARRGPPASAPERPGRPPEGPTISEPHEPPAPQPGRRAPYARHVRRPHRLSRRHLSETVKPSPARAEPHDADELAARSPTSTASPRSTTWSGPGATPPARRTRPSRSRRRPGPSPTTRARGCPLPDLDGLPSVEELLTREPWAARPSPARAEPHDADEPGCRCRDLDTLPAIRQLLAPAPPVAPTRLRHPRDPARRSHPDVAARRRRRAGDPPSPPTPARRRRPVRPLVVASALGARGRRARWPVTSAASCTRCRASSTRARTSTFASTAGWSPRRPACRRSARSCASSTSRVGPHDRVVPGLDRDASPTACT